jgi:hypothetical protein
MPNNTIAKPATAQLLLVRVANKYHPQHGAALFDAEARWMTMEQAERFDPGLRAANTPIMPQLSGRQVPTQMDIDKMARYEAQVAAVPTVFAVQREHGRSFKEAGIWLVSGPDVLRTSIVIRNAAGIWDTKPGVEWVDGPFLTVDEARTAHPEIPPADVAPAQPGPRVTPETLALRAEVAKLRDALAKHTALREAQAEESAAVTGEANDAAGGVRKDGRR